MKIQDNQYNVQKSDNFAEQDFGIMVCEKAFKILYSGIYSDKITAILRELGTNAYDSHVMANKEKEPFLVQLPNNLEPTFKIRDYGVGLSEDEMRNVYTKYFLSTKTNSNTQVGCLGLGSKTPFSYTDMFNVSSYYNGIKYLYCCIINEKGAPSINKMGQIATTECNGLEVSFAVKREDFSQFRDKAKSVYRWFSTKPTIQGQQITFEQAKPIIETNEYQINKENNNNYVIMGNVAYPVNNNNNLQFKYKYYSSFHIIANIGDVDFTASRESLEYTQKTNTFLETKIKLIEDSIQKETQKEIDKSECYFDACKFYNENQLIAEKCTFKGQKLNTHIKISDKDEFRCKFIGRNWNKKATKEREITFNSSNPFRIENFVFVINDITKGIITRSREYIYSGASKIYIIEDGMKQKLIDLLGVNDKYFKLASDLPKPTANMNTGPRNKIVRAYKIGDGSSVSHRYHKSHSFLGMWVKEDNLDLTKGGVYVELDGMKPKTNSNYDIKNKYDLINKLETTEIYGIRKSLIKKVKANKNWKELNEHIEELKNKHKKDLDILPNISYYNNADFKKWDLHTADPSLKSVYDNMDYIEKNWCKLNSIKQLFNIQESKNEPKDLKECKEKYPLLGHIGTYYNINDKKLKEHAIEYVKAMKKYKNY